MGRHQWGHAAWVCLLGSLDKAHAIHGDTISGDLGSGMGEGTRGNPLGITVLCFLILEVVAQGYPLLKAHQNVYLKWVSVGM